MRTPRARRAESRCASAIWMGVPAWIAALLQVATIMSRSAGASRRAGGARSARTRRPRGCRRGAGRSGVRPRRRAGPAPPRRRYAAARPRRRRPSPSRRRRGAREGRARARLVGERVDEEAVGCAAAGGDPAQHRGAARLREPRTLDGEPRLADAALAEEDERPRPLLEERLEEQQRRPAAAYGRRFGLAEQPPRDVGAGLPSAGRTAGGPTSPRWIAPWSARVSSETPARPAARSAFSQASYWRSASARRPDSARRS